jgi:hypothetical protein
MPASQDKIITKLHERRQIEADLRRMLTATSETELRRQAQRIAARGSQVIPAIISNLDQADTHFLNAMGVVATFLDHEQVSRALRQAVLQSQRTDRGRIGAMTILERFLGEPPDDDLLASLADPEEVAVSSLEEVLDQVEGNPSVLIEYVEALDQQEPDVVLTVIRALRAKGGAQVVEPLRMMAQDVREEIAIESLQALGTVRLVEAARALQGLMAVSAPALNAAARRSLLKLQFTGVEVDPLPLPEAEWRALVSPVSGQGQQNVWFIQEDKPARLARFLNLLLSDRAGVIEAVGHTQVPALILPPRRVQGYVHDVSLQDGSGAVLMLEASFDLGRRLVVEALAHNRETQIPVAGPLRLLNPWLWEYRGGDSLAPRELPDWSSVDGAHAERLVGHPAFVTWSARDQAVWRVAGDLLRHPGWDPEVWVRRLAGELFSDPAARQVLHHRLVMMSEWLLLAHEQIESRIALAAAEGMLNEEPQDQPFVRALIRRDLESTLNSLKRDGELPFGV